MIHHFDVLGACLFDSRYRCDGRITGCQHGIEHEHLTVGEFIWHFRTEASAVADDYLLIGLHTIAARDGQKFDDEAFLIEFGKALDHAIRLANLRREDGDG